MSTSVKRLLFVLMVGILVFSVAACGGKGNEPANSTAGSKDSGSTSKAPIKLRILWWGSQDRHDVTLKALDVYTEKNPHITFESEFSGWGEGYWDKLSTQAAARNAPDLIQMDAGYLAEYASRNQLADLSEGIDTSDMNASLVDSGKYKGVLYAIALGDNAFGMAFNKPAIEKLGITMPESGWTWDDYFRMGEEAKPKLESSKYPLFDFSSWLDVYGVYQLSHGKGYYVTEDGKFNIDRDIWIDWQNRFVDLRERGIVPPPEITVTDMKLDPQVDLMVNGTTLIRSAHAAESTAYYDLMPNAVEMVTLPKQGDGAAGWLKPSMLWSVSATSNYIEESKKFIDWFINDEEAAEILGTSRGMPVSKKILEYLDPKFKEGDKLGIRLISDTAKNAQTFHPDPSGWANYRVKEYTVIAEELMFGRTTPEQAYEKLVQKAKEYE